MRQQGSASQQPEGFGVTRAETFAPAGSRDERHHPPGRGPALVRT